MMWHEIMCFNEIRAGYFIKNRLSARTEEW